MLAARTGVPIIPVAIHGIGKMMPRGTIQLIDTQMVIQPLGVLYANPTMDKPHLDLKRRTADLIAQALQSGVATSDIVGKLPITSGGAMARSGP